MQRGKEDVFSGKDNELVSLLLIGFIGETERNFIDNPALIKSQKKSKEAASYEEQCNELAARLRKLGAALINKIDINNFKVYKPAEEIPQDVQMYTNVSDNLSTVIVHDILYQTTKNLALVKMERWAMISRLCFYSNDFYSAATIISALRAVAIEQANLFNDITKTAQETIRYFESFFLRMKYVLELEQKCLKKDQIVIPFLHVLPNLLERVDSTPRELMGELTSPRKEKKRIRLSYSMVKLKLKGQDDENTSKILAILSKSYNEKAMDYYLYVAPAIAKARSTFDLNNMMEKFGLLGPHEHFLILLSKLLELEKKCEPNDSQLIYNIRHIVSNARISDKKKHFEIAKLLSDKTVFPKQTRQLLKEIQKVLIQINKLDTKQISREFMGEEGAQETEKTGIVPEAEIKDQQQVESSTDVKSPRNLTDQKREHYKQAQQIALYRKSPSLTPRSSKEDGVAETLLYSQKPK